MGRSNMCNIHTAKKTERTQEEITISGNPAKPQGEDGATMLKRMSLNKSSCLKKPVFMRVSAISISLFIQWFMGNGTINRWLAD